MILTASKPVNARIGRPSTNAPNPRFLIEGDKVSVRNRVLGDNINGNIEWIITEEDEFFSTEGFHLTEEIKSIPFSTDIQKVPDLLMELEISSLWDSLNSKGEKINIGVIDNGVANHPLLNGRVKELNKNVPVNDDLSSHGTTMACIIAGFGESSGYSGVAPMVENIFSYRIDVGNEGCNVEASEVMDALEAMETANVNIINMSFTCQGASFFPSNESGRKLQAKINALADKNCMIVCSTGNDTERKRNVFPASYDNLVSVTGYNKSGIGLNIPSNYWNGVVVAMSVKHYFDDSNDPLFENSNGTSSASAIITGCIACAYTSIKQPKLSFIEQSFRTMQMLKDDDDPQINIPKFQTSKFIKSLKA